MTASGATPISGEIGIVDSTAAGGLLFIGSSRIPSAHSAVVGGETLALAMLYDALSGEPCGMADDAFATDK